MDRETSYPITRKIPDIAPRFLTVGGTIKVLEDKFNEYCCIMLNDFMDRYAEFRKDTIRQLVSEGIIRTTIVDTYSIYELLKPDHLASLLFYKGVLTISGTFGSMSVLSIPNKNNQELYGKVFQEIMEK